DRIDLITRVWSRTCDAKIGSDMRANRVIAACAPAGVSVRQKQFSVARKVLRRIVAWLRSGKKQLIHDCRAETRRQHPCRFANVPAHEFLIFYRRIERMIPLPQEFLHNRRPEGCRSPDSKRVADWSSIEIACPNGDGVFFIEANSPRVAKAAAGSGLCRYTLFEGQWRTKPKTFLARVVVAQNISDNR